MAYNQKRRGKYRARFSDPLGNVQSRTFVRKADADRFLRQIDADRLRGQWVDPRNADTPLAAWARSSCRCADASHRPRKRPIAATSTSTCCRDSVHTALASCRPTRLRTG